MTGSCRRNDLVNQRIAWVLWGMPMGLFVIGTFLGPFARTLLWTPALLVAGAACVVNAFHCQRLHCYLTGPLFLAAAVVTVLRGFEVLALPWIWIGAAVVGGTVLAHILEWVSGKYRTAQCGANDRGR
jgi:hypothetical protein